MRKVLAIRIICLLALLVSLPIKAYDFESEGICYNIDGDNVTVCSNDADESWTSNYRGDIVIPSQVSYNGKTYKVTAIGYKAFHRCEGLTSVLIPNSVTSIGYVAFDICTSLTSITLPYSVTSIGNGAFMNCSNLKKVVSEIEKPYEINSVFDNISSDAELIVPKGTKLVYQSTAGWDQFKNIVEAGGGSSSEDVRRFESGGITYNVNDNGTTVTVTAGNTKYKGDISIPSSVYYNGKNYDVTSIGDRAFYECSGLTSITIPNSVTSIGSSAFWYCSGLTSITIPNSVSSIGSWAFLECSSLTSITIPNSVTTIDSYAFCRCSGLTTIKVESDNTKYDSRDNCNAIIETASNTLIAGCGNTVIPNSVTSIMNDVFNGCSGLTSITIPNSVTSIGTQIIANCSNLTSIKVESGNPKYDSRDNCNAIIETASNTIIAGCKNTVIPNSVTSIGFSAFRGCSGLTSISIPNSVTSIADYAFIDCSGLSSVTIPNGVTSIGDHTFGSCSSLTSVIIPNSVTSIGYCAFYGCSGLASISIPNSVSSIGDAAFSGCSGLTSIVSEIENPFAIDKYLFYSVDKDIYATATLTVPAGTKTKYQSTSGWNQFKNIVEAGGGSSSEDVRRFESGGITYNVNDNGTTVTVTAGNTKYKGDISIPSSVYYNGKNYDVTSIGYAAFGDCTGLTSISIPNSVGYIQYGAFQNCSGLSSITLPKSIKSIVQYAFMGCYNLTSIISEIESLFPLEGSTFENSTFNNATLTVPAGTKYLYQSTGGWMNFLNIYEEGSGEVQTKRTIHVATAGTLSRYISDNEKYKIEELTLTGEINGTDFRLLRDMAGRSNWDFGSSDGKLAVLNLSGVKIVAGGEYIWGYDQSGSSSSYYLLNNNEIPSSVFMGCKGLVSVTLPDNVVSIANSAFFGCGMTSIAIPNSVKYIGGSAFDGTPWYDNQPDGLIYLGKFAYKYKGEMPANTSITINDGTIGIVGRAFDHCEGLSSIIIPNSIIYIGDYAFYYCRGLKSVTIPNSVTSIELGAFNGCSGLTTISSEIKNPFAVYCFDSSTYSTAELTVPDGTRSAYQSTEGWKNFTKIYEFSENQEVEFTFNRISYEGNMLTKNAYVKSVEANQTIIEIPASVTYNGTAYQVKGMEDNAFSGCNLAALVWNPEAMLPDNAFNGATLSSNFLLYVKSASYAPSSVKNVVVNGTAQAIMLSDDGGQFYCPQAFTAEKISYTHNFNMETGGDGKGWETIALPFDVQKISHSTRGEIIPFASYNSSTSFKPFWLATMSSNGFRHCTNIMANQPYIIAMPNSSNYRNDYILMGDVTFAAENVNVPKTPTLSGKFIPAYSTVKKASNVYAINAVNRYVSETGGYDAGSRFISNLRDVRPFEAYITESSTRGVIEIGSGDGTTGMDEILGIIDSDKEVSIYTLNGQKVMQTKQSKLDNDMSQLPRGVYIVNGKKIVK